MLFKRKIENVFMLGEPLKIGETHKTKWNSQRRLSSESNNKTRRKLKKNIHNILEKHNGLFSLYFN